MICLIIVGERLWIRLEYMRLFRLNEEKRPLIALNLDLICVLFCKDTGKIQIRRLDIKKHK